MKVLVTGANGFIGRHLVQKLVAQGSNDIHVFVRESSLPFSSTAAKIFTGDILNPESIEKALQGVDVVFHLIAKTHDARENHEASREYFRINVDGTKNLLEKCRDAGVKHFIYFSSIKVMTEESRYILDENCPPSPTTAYGLSKLEAENLVLEYGNKYRFKTTIIRLPLVYGPGNKGNIYRIIKTIDSGRFMLVGRGENIRSMVYVGNVVDVALKIAGNEEADGNVYIVTDGIDYTVKQLYETISKGLSKKILPFHIPIGIARPLALVGDLSGYIARKSLPFNTDVLNKLTGSLRFSSRRVQDEIGFKPKYNLFNTVSDTVEWYRENR